MKIFREDFPKLCWARPGYVVRLLDERLQAEPEPFMVCVNRHNGGKLARPHTRSCIGLYAETSDLFLVSLETGETRKMPHLSSRVEIVRDAVLYAPPNEKPTNNPCDRR